MCCKNATCPKCDPGIEAFYQEKVKEAESMTEAHFKSTGIRYSFEDNLDAKYIWYEYCALKESAKAEDDQDKLYEMIEKDYSPNELAELLKNPNEWQ